MDTNEKRLARKVVDALLGAGFGVRVWDSEEFTTPNVLTDAEAVMKELGSTDYDELVAFSDGRVGFKGQRMGFVRLIWGEGEDLVQDYSVSLEKTIEGALV